jgi:hypothetical protein
MAKLELKQTAAQVREVAAAAVAACCDEFAWQPELAGRHVFKAIDMFARICAEFDATRTAQVSVYNDGPYLYVKVHHPRYPDECTADVYDLISGRYEQDGEWFLDYLTENLGLVCGDRSTVKYGTINTRIRAAAQQSLARFHAETNTNKT